jgi:hypothetical protein
VSIIIGLAIGLVIAALQLVAGHAAIDYQTLSLHGNSTLALAVPSILIPLAIVWGWTWVSDRWSGRSFPRLVLFTAGLIFGAASAAPLEAILSFSPDRLAFSGTFTDLAIGAGLFVLPVVIAGTLYWLFGSGKLPLSLPTLAVGYLVGLPLALLFPPAAMGTVAGTAAGHAWRSPGARTLIATLVIVLMVITMIELPLAAAAVDGSLRR